MKIKYAKREKDLNQINIHAVNPGFMQNLCKIQEYLPRMKTEACKYSSIYDLQTSTKYSHLKNTVDTIASITILEVFLYLNISIS